MPIKRPINVYITMFSLVLMLVVFSLPSTGIAGGEIVYLPYNVHPFQKGSAYNASYANWTDPGPGHVLFPVNTAVRVSSFSRWRAGRGFFLTTVDDGKKIAYEFHKQRMGMGIDEYVKLITSPQQVSMKGLSKKDREGIRLGKAMVGMTKKGVVMALGYPACHRTPSLEDGVYVYWQNRFKTLAVEFDSNGKVIRIRQ
ncbi:MAG: hypothetical protein JRJ85_24950 [Deltaproteobacteria bacterium]|nr:hypothetical protein [Deltaproteobacteria bacterium]